MKKLDDGLWIADQSLRVVGVDLGARMTVVRLTDGGLLLHSPIRPTPDLVGAVRSTGRVSAIVAPNRFHHLFAGPWMEAFPGTPLFVAPGLESKRADLAITGVLSDTPEILWRDSLEQTVLRGIPLSNEVVFFHRTSRTLIATDLAFHIGPGHPAPTRLLFRLSGAYGHLAPTFLERLLVRDRAAFRTVLERILQWPFERVIVAHGDVLETGGREALARGFACLLDAG